MRWKTNMKTRTQTLALAPGAKAIAVVAHPDDEVIWMGGTIRRFKEAHWTVLSLCRASDNDRAPKFRRVCQHLGVRGFIEDLPDSGELNEEDWIERAESFIKNQTAGKGFDFLFSHGENGEYGHINHKMAHKAIGQLAGKGENLAENILFFDYQKQDRKLLPMIPAGKPDFILELKSKEYEEKRRIIAEMYGYPYDGIDVNLCTNVEAFRIFA